MVDDESAAAYPAAVVASFVESAHLLYASEELDETLGRLTDAAVSIVPGCDAASLSLLENDLIVTTAATDPIAEKLDAIQYETRQGPCWDAAHEDRLVCTNDLTSDQRWPDFARRAAAEIGVGSLLACRLTDPRRPDATIGALNLHSLSPGAYDDDDRMLALLLASVAGVSVHAAQRQTELRTAMESRDVIGQAMGVLMAQNGFTSSQALDQLRQASQRLNVKLRDVARRVADSVAEPGR